MFSRNNATVQTITPAIHSTVSVFGRGGQMQQGSCESFCLYLSIYILSKIHVSSYPCPATKCIWVDQSEKLVPHVFCGLEVCFRILPILTQTLTFYKKDIMCSPGCHHLPDRIPGIPGVHANYSLLGMCLEHVFQLNLFFLFISLKFSQVKQSS